MRVRKAAGKGVSGDCYRHHSHQQRLTHRVTKPIPINRAVLPYAAMRSNTLQSLLQSTEASLLAAHPTSVAFAIKPAEDIPGEAEIRKAPPVKLATDNGHDVRGDQDRYDLWLKEFAWTPKSLRNSVTSLVHPKDKQELVPVMDIQPLLIHGIPLGTLKVKTLRYLYVPKSWQRVKEQHLKRSANARQERTNNVHHTEVESATRKADFIRTTEMAKRYVDSAVLSRQPNQQAPSEVEGPPWPAANDSSHQGEQSGTPEDGGHHVHQPVPLAGEHNFMEQVQDMRRSRQAILQREHEVRSSDHLSNGGIVDGFMNDVYVQMHGRHVYAKRLKRLLMLKARREARAEHHRDARHANLVLAMDQYRQRVLMRQYLKQHGEGMTYRLVTVIENVTEDQATALVSFAAAYPMYSNRDMWCQKEVEQVHPDFNRSVTSSEIIRRAEVAVRKEDTERQEHEAKRQVYKLRSWLRNHDDRTVSVFSKILRKSVTDRVFDPSHKKVVSAARQREARRVASIRAVSYVKALAVSKQRDNEEGCVQDICLAPLSDMYSKLIHAGQASKELLHTHNRLLNKACEQLNMKFSEDHGLILPGRVFDGNPIVTSPAMH